MSPVGSRSGWGDQTFITELSKAIWKWPVARVNSTSPAALAPGAILVAIAATHQRQRLPTSTGVRTEADHASMDLKTLLVGTRQSIAGTVYRMIVVLSVVEAGAKAYDKDPADLP